MQYIYLLDLWYRLWFRLAIVATADAETSSTPDVAYGPTDSQGATGATGATGVARVWMSSPPRGIATFTSAVVIGPVHHVVIMVMTGTCVTQYILQ